MRHTDKSFTPHGFAGLTLAAFAFALAGALAAQPSQPATGRTTADRVREILRQIGGPAPTPARPIPAAPAAPAATTASAAAPAPTPAPPAASTAPVTSPAPSTLPATAPAPAPAQPSPSNPAIRPASASATEPVTPGGAPPSGAAPSGAPSAAPPATVQQAFSGTSAAPADLSRASREGAAGEPESLKPGPPALDPLARSAGSLVPSQPAAATSTPLVSTAATRLPTDGAINVSSDPEGAEVVLDRKVIGLTPLFKRAIEPGLHDLELTRAGAPIHRRTIKIAAGKVLNLKLPGGIPGLAPPETFETGTLTLEIGPKGTSVYLPGRKLLGKTPLKAHPLRAGLYALTLEAPGHRSEEREVRIEPRRETRVVASLTPGAELIDVFRKRRRDRERDLYLSEARRLLAKKQHDMALERTRQALAADPESADAFRQLAEIYAATGDRAGEEEARKKAAALTRRRAGDWKNEAEALKQDR